jgi:lipopolysaccharide transport system permease protein
MTNFVAFVIPFLLQLGLYLSPVGFSSSVVSEQWATVYALNPMVGVIEGFRWAILGESFHLRWDVQLISASLSTTLLASGVVFFKRYERDIADVI